ncbi:MAG: alpha-amylase family glycosyl hydrolase [Chloroflexota bacterium]
MSGTMEFHICRQARDRYRFDESLFSLSGNVILANFHAVRLFAQKMNDRRDLVHYPEQAVKAGQINAMGLIDEVLHYVVGLYRRQKNPQVMQQSLEWLEARLGRPAVDAALLRFVDEFPPLSVYRQEMGAVDYLAGETGGVSHRQIALEELLLLWLANTNPAFAPFSELFDDALLEKETAYRQIVDGLYAFFETQPRFGPADQNLIDLLRDPAVQVPHSLSGQLEYMRERWSALLGRYLYRLLGSLDLIHEEDKMRFMGPGPIRPVELIGLEVEAERYSLDRDWMPRVVLMAKSTYVWLDQLSRKYGRSITRLDQIPDEELDTLAQRGFTALWLIGLWQRSRASQRIKQLCGNPEAVASAYSLYDYQIADDLGGEEAFQNLRARAWQRGIRMAGDMVPNHVGIDGKWVIDHPDWFVALDHNPFPSYTFNGPDLSWDERVGIYLEDHYYSRSDAAVVFKRLDRWTGDVRYIYHGNDGTSMPWNDTAQLNYLNPEVREAVIQTILHVARRFPVIRFDAAMTLAKRHFQRLWFPEPGSGGDIPTRAGHGLPKEQFDAAMPQEFWREVVDRVAQEAPDTLLLAEAFWLMEGYFVRTLGMHRVYNSAFMNMLKAEENAKYRASIKNVLEFDPEILKRFVNFMNNPDEETAVAQFGKDGKYLGVCIMMSTMPGLPMFGHGQVEGLTEKYGMEYRRAYWDEQPDEELVRRHEREVFPLLHRRYLFAGVDNFLLYDFYTPEGQVNENVFAYSNRVGGEGALVVYHNKFDEARGWIKTSAAYSVKNGDDGDRVLVQKTLGDGLGLPNQDGYYCIFSDHITGLEYIRSCRELHEKGLYVELGAFKYHVFLDFRQVQDNEWRHYAHLTGYLNGRGVPSIQEALRETFLQPIHRVFKALIGAETIRRLMAARLTEPEGTLDEALLDEVQQQALDLLTESQQLAGIAGDPLALAQEMRRHLAALLRLPVLEALLPMSETPETAEVVSYVKTNLPDPTFLWGCLVSWWGVRSLGRLSGEVAFESQSRSWIDEWLLGRVMATTLQDLGMESQAAWRAVGLVKLLTSHQRWCAVKGPSLYGRAFALIETLLRDDEARQWLGVNRYQGVLWFSQQAFEELLWWLMLLVVVQPDLDALPPTEMTERVLGCYQILLHLLQAGRESGYRVEQLLSRV